jgi:hypothetical protein
MEFRKPVLMLISLFNVLNALADGDYTYNDDDFVNGFILYGRRCMGNTSAVASCTLLHTEYASIGIY